jgi:hypothetical protein
MNMNRMAFYSPKMIRVFSAFLTHSPVALVTEYDRYKVDINQLKTIQIPNQQNTQKIEDLTESFNEKDEEYVRVIIMGPMW